MTEAQARDRMAAQASREQRLAVADIVIDNSGSLDDLDRRVAELWADLRRRASVPHPRGVRDIFVGEQDHLAGAAGQAGTVWL
jgi:hypothetical protein